MNYFNSLPKVAYTKENGIRTIYTNLMSRASVVPSILNNLLVYYDYDVKDMDTPEIVAYKYYGDINRFWIVLYCNQINNPLWDWPLNSNKFEKYVLNKYANTLNDVHHYEIIKTTIFDPTIQPDVEKIICSEEEYNSTIENQATYNIDSKNTTIITSKKIITNYDYELELNDSKRKIKILNKEYASQLEKEFVNLMKS